MSIEVGTGLCRDRLTTTEVRACLSRLGGYGYGFDAGACLKPMSIVLEGGALLSRVRFLLDSGRKKTQLSR